MTEAEALAALEAMIAPDSVPTLTSDEVDAILAFGRRADEYGRYPSDADWSETWDLNAAAAEGWRRKAAKVAGAYDFGGDSQSYSRSQMHAMCLEMARQYRKGMVVSVSLATGLGVDTDILANVNDTYGEGRYGT